MPNKTFPYTNFKEDTFVLGVQLKKITWPNREVVPQKQFCKKKKKKKKKKNKSTKVFNRQISKLSNGYSIS